MQVEMRRGFSRFIELIHLAGDLLLLNAAFIIAYIVKFDKALLQEVNDHYFILHVFFNILWIVLVMVLNTYNTDRVTKWEKIIWNIFKSVGLHILLVVGFIFSIKGFYYSRGQLAIAYLLFTVLLLCWRMLFVWLLRLYRKAGMNYRNIIIIGAGSAGNRIYNYFVSDNTHGYVVKGFFDDNPDMALKKELILGMEWEVENYIKKEKVDEMYCALPFTAVRKIRSLMVLADNNLIRFKIVPDFRSFFNKKVNVENYNGVPVFSIRKEPLENVFHRIVKRTFDIGFSFLVLIPFLCFIVPIVGVLIKLSSSGPVFFMQKRSGRDNKEFVCIKFRTMELNNDADTAQASKKDARITKIGKFLRKTNMDELPQFLNVLIGNMSVVGPRPHMIKHTIEYAHIIDKFMVRQLVKPGITGLAQVNGFRGATETPRKMIRRVRYDLWYVENWSLLLDLKIILLTVYNMFKGEENAY